MPNKKTVVRTNSTPNSIKEVPLKAVTFAELWAAYPKETALCKDPATGKAAFSDECAIRTGVVFFKDYWERKGEKSPTGDHIDLWDGESLTAASLRGRVNNFLRFTIGVGALWYADLGEAKKIMFWEIA
jgi:hypothetical protein